MKKTFWVAGTALVIAAVLNVYNPDRVYASSKSSETTTYASKGIFDGTYSDQF